MQIMKKYENIILLSDMDGTLLNSDSKVSEKNREAIRHFIAGGGHFGIATGRGHVNALKFLENIEINTPSILYNGSVLYDYSTGQIIEMSLLPNLLLVDYIRNCLSEFENVLVHVYSPDMNFIVSPQHLADAGELSWHKPNTFCRIDDIIEKPWIKILLNGTPEDLAGLDNKLKEYGLEDAINKVFSSETYLELLPQLVSKGSMLVRLREHVGPDYKIYAVGDYNNDVEMLVAADIGIATQNALQNVKDAADMVTVSNDENAIAHIIYHLIESSNENVK